MGTDLMEFACPQAVWMSLPPTQRIIENRATSGFAGTGTWGIDRTWRGGSTSLLSVVLSHLFIAYFIPIASDPIVGAPSSHWTAFMRVIVMTESSTSTSLGSGADLHGGLSVWKLNRLIDSGIDHRIRRRAGTRTERTEAETALTAAGVS
jgi:hypothetical protein